MKASFFNVIVFLALATILTSSAGALGKQEIIDYYWHRAAKAFVSHDPNTAKLAYSFLAVSYFSELGRGEVPKRVDSSTSRLFFSSGKLDSTQIVRGKGSAPFPIEVLAPNIFDSTYIRTFFPNDTGGRELAIGFDTDAHNDPRPVGIATIDRDQNTLIRLHAVYPVKPGFDRFSRSYHFTQSGGWIFADSITETGIINRFLLNQDYRVRTVISQFTVRVDSTTSR